MSNLVINISKIISGNALAHAVGILLIPIHTRIDSLDDFGLMSPKGHEYSVIIVAFCVILIRIIYVICIGIINFFRFATLPLGSRSAL